MKRAGQILILDGDMEPSLSILRSLAERGYPVLLAATSADAIGGYSRYCSELALYPDPLSNTHDFVHWLSEFCRDNDVGLVIPVTERTLVPIYQNRGALADLPLAMPDNDVMDLALDKAKTFALARECGISIPQSIELTAIEQVGQLDGELKYPVVLKPMRSVTTGAGSAGQHSVAYAFDADEFRAYARSYLHYGGILVQEFFAGVGAGIEVLASEGEVLYAFQHERIHEVPLSGGGSSYRRATPLNPQLLEAAKSLILAMRWTGVAMVEFKLNKDSGEFTLMEVNGRFWGSLPLAINAGADFPWMLVRLLKEGVTRFDPSYVEDMRCRKLSRDILWYESVLREQYDPRLFTPPVRGELVRDLMGVLSPKHTFDVQRWRDPLPGLIDVYRILKIQASRLVDLFSQRRELRRLHSQWKSGLARSLIRDSRNILVLCYGNINRSAAAGLLLSPYAQDLGVAVQSAGFHHEEGRPMDPYMRGICAEYGVDASRHASRQVDEQMISEADAVFVMDLKNLALLTERFPGVDRSKVLAFAGSNATPHKREVPDPYGRALVEYRECFDELVTGVDVIKGVLSQRLLEID